MTRIGAKIGLLLFLGLSTHWLSAQETVPGPVVLHMSLQNQAVTPVMAQFIARSIKDADQEGATCLVIELNTPGGYVNSTERIVTDILNSPVPVVVYVSPPPGRAASAGMFITMAGHIAAMAPATHIGAAHPVQMGGLPGLPNEPSSTPEKEDTGSETERGDVDREFKTLQPQTPMEQKILNDTVALAKSIAEFRGRNVKWAELAVSESKVAIASEAVELNIVDLLATDLTDLLNQINGREVTLRQGAEQRTVHLRTGDAQVRTLDMWWGEQLLAVISSPNVAMILMLFGVYGILYEFYSPGWGVAGTLGVISLVLAFFGMSVLPINYAGLALIAVAIALIVAEAFVTSFGALGAGGIICLVIGGTMLVDSPHAFLRVSLEVLIPMALATGVIIVFLVGSVVRAQQSKVLTGGEGLVGLEAVAEQEFTPMDGTYRGQVFVHGEIWNSRSLAPVSAGDRVKVQGREGLELTVSQSEQ